MGGGHSARKASFDAEGEVDFDHFQILRAIGKGSFGKVCIVQKKDTKKMYAMKYMNKQACIKKDAIRNVLREIDILQRIEHPFLVNLWFAFQDEEDMFMVVDLLMGGDLRYHIQQEIKFDEERVRLYIVEIAMAQDYLRSEHIIHRDIKPDNILLDEEGHVHITDFNIATVLQEGQLATSMSGTKPYMAPEVFDTAVDECPGYSYPVDWWSLGICAYEMLRGKRPYDIHSGTSLEDIRQGFTVPISYSSSWNEGMRNILKQLLTVDPAERISTFEDLKSHPFLSDLDPQKVLRREFKPTFVPAKDHLNCDPTFELEEMIIEAKPLHKKKKRLAKQNSKRESQNNLSGMDMDPLQLCLENINDEFKVYNREDEKSRRRSEKRN
ncbi:PREDICTED: serine/threonine-protein kinase 32B-like isoform X2 [Priapulus caudatus]|uniref:Serine/threonine-protein kinase 32B-like isoform X2 n=1 Tax=Priapulus caudatus TaxID=37621 RepID=A0ABM1ESR0_PRICU|nr:PREDICTED: serine/threonine-protein kinase 32B-like isoform X2 [Priapulus caudatus]